MKSEIGEVILGLGFIDGLLGFGEMEFECSPCIFGGILVIPLYDITFKDFGIGDFNDTNANELVWCDGFS